jgi:hypothetical protein
VNAAMKWGPMKLEGAKGPWLCKPLSSVVGFLASTTVVFTAKWPLRQQTCLASVCASYLVSYSFPYVTRLIHIDVCCTAPYMSLGVVRVPNITRPRKYLKSALKFVLGSDVSVVWHIFELLK